MSIEFSFCFLLPDSWSKFDPHFSGHPPVTQKRRGRARAYQSTLPKVRLGAESEVCVHEGKREGHFCRFIISGQLKLDPTGSYRDSCSMNCPPE